MYQLLGYFWRLCLLRETPQNLSRSVELFWLVLTLNILAGVSQILGTDYVLAEVFPELVVAYTMEFLLLAAILYGAGKIQRFLQIMTAQLGCDVILSVIILVTGYVLQLTQANDLFGMIFLLLLMWGITINGHIYRHGLEIPFAGGILIALSVFLIRTTVVLSIFYAGD